MADVIFVNNNFGPLQSLDIAALQKYIQLAGNLPVTPSDFQSSLQISDSTTIQFEGLLLSLGAVYANITARCKAFADAYPQASSTLSNILDHAQSAGSPDAPSIYAEILRNLKAYSTASAESEKVQLQAVVTQLVSAELEAIAALIAQAQANAGENSKFLSETFDQDQSALSAQSDTLGSEIRAYAAKEGPPEQESVLADLATVSTSLDDLLQANSAAIVAVQTMASIWVQIANDLRSIQATVQTDLNVSTPFEIVLIIAKNLEKKWNDLAAFVYRFKEATAMQL